MSEDGPRLPLILLGAGGHAKVLLALANAAGWKVLGVCDPELSRQSVHSWRELPVLGGDEAVSHFEPGEVGLVNGLGQRVVGCGRRRIFETWRAQGFRFPFLIHPAAWVAQNVQLAEGVQIMAGAVVQPDCQIGENSIVNTRAGVDHDCLIGAHVHIAPGATLCGGVTVHARAYVGSGSTVIQGLSVGNDAVVGAGATVVKDLASGAILLGAATRLKAG